MLGLETYVLRFWETEFPQLQPGRTRTGQRLYTSEHVQLLKKIKSLLYHDKLTIDGARMRLEEHGRFSGVLGDVKKGLQEIKKILE